MNTSTARPSGADITIPSPAPAASPSLVERVGIDRVLNGIRTMLDGCRTSDRNALLTIAITALIEAGVDTAPRIVGAAAALGFKREHAGAMLRNGRGWARGDDGAYRLVAG